MDAQIEFSLDENSAPEGNLTVEVDTNRDNAILIGDNLNKDMIAITFYPDKTILDIKNSDGKFDSLVAACDNTYNQYLQFSVDNVTVNPDLSIDLTLTNSPIKRLRIRPDEIARVNSKGAEATVYSGTDLLNTSFPKNLLEFKTRVDGLDKFPSQLFNTLNNFNNTDTKTFDINGKELLVAKNPNAIFVSDGEFLKKIDNSKTLLTAKKDENVMQFSFEDENKKLTKIPDDVFNDVCSFLGVSSNDNAHAATPEQLEKSSEIQSSKAFKYIKSKASFYQNLEKPDEKPKTNGEKSPSSKPAEDKGGKVEEDTIDFTYPLKLLGFALLFLGFFGGGLLPVILAICIGGSGFAFSAQLEKVKVGGPKLKHAKKEKKKNKNGQDEEEQKLTNKDLVNVRIENLSKMQQKYKKTLDDLKALYTSRNDAKTKILQKIQNSTDQTETVQLNALLSEVDKILGKIKTQITEYENTFNLYGKLIDDSANELKRAVQFVDSDENQLYEDYEAKYNQMCAERKTLALLEQQLSQLKTKLASTNDTAEKQTLTDQIAQTQTKVQAQKVTESLAIKSADEAKRLYNLTKTGKQIYAENMDGGLTYNNVQKGIRLLEDYKTEAERLDGLIRQSVSENQYTQDVEFAI